MTKKKYRSHNSSYLHNDTGNSWSICWHPYW